MIHRDGIVLYTSGVWAKADPVPEWIRTVLSQTSCLFLSTGAFHAQAIEEERFTAALRVIADQGR